MRADLTRKISAPTNNLLTDQRSNNVKSFVVSYAKNIYCSFHGYVTFWQVVLIIQAVGAHYMITVFLIILILNSSLCAPTLKNFVEPYPLIYTIYEIKTCIFLMPIQLIHSLLALFPLLYNSSLLFPYKSYCLLVPKLMS